MISDPNLFVECDRCGERVDFDLSLVTADPVRWQMDERFAGWWIDWQDRNGDALCPDCRTMDSMGEE